MDTRFRKKQFCKYKSMQNTQKVIANLNSNKTIFELEIAKEKYKNY